MVVRLCVCVCVCVRERGREREINVPVFLHSQKEADTEMQNIC